MAYQGYGSGLDLASLRALQEIATGGLRPDLTILLDVPAEVGLARKTEAADQTRFETAFDIAFHRRVRDGFRSLAAAEPGRVSVVDATQDEPAVWDDVRSAAARLTGLAEAPNEPDRSIVRMQG
jgi:dTMP kinase